MNVVDVPELCTFIFPAMINDGALNISVSTSGKSPVASQKIRDGIKEIIPDFMPAMIDRLSERRPAVVRENISHSDKKNIFNNLYEYGITHDGQIPDEIVADEINRKKLI